MTHPSRSTCSRNRRVPVVTRLGTARLGAARRRHDWRLWRRTLRSLWVLLAVVAGVPLSGGCNGSPQQMRELPAFDDVAGAVENARAEATPRCSIGDRSALKPSGVRAASGPIALGSWAGREVILIADEDESALHIADAADMQLIASQTLPASPAHLLILPDGRVALTLRQHNRVLLLAPGATPEQGLSQHCSALVAQEPIALAATKQHLLVASGFGAALSRFDLDSLTLVDQLPLGREPRGLMLSQDQQVAWVSHMVGGLITRVDLQQGHSSELVARRAAAEDDEASRAVQGFAIAAYVDREGQERLLAPQVSSRDPRTERFVSSGYGSSLEDSIFLPWVASIDAGGVKMLGVGRESPRNWRRLCLLPRHAVVHENRLLIACLDEGTVVETDARFVDPMTAVYRRYRVAEGANGLAVADDGRMFVWSLFDHQLSRIDRTADSEEVASTQLVVPRRKSSEWNEERLLGRALFHERDDFRISANGASCESCHPDGRDDGLRWSDGTSTMFLAGRLEHSAPFGWRGEHETLTERVQNTCRRLGGLGFNRKEDLPLVDHLVQYMLARPAPPPPLPQSTDEHAQIRRGEELFSDTLSCSACHPKGGANGSKLRVDGRLMDTPTLHYIAAAGPFFHDNRYASLEELLSDPTQPMDLTAQLDERGRGDLAAYLRSLPFGAVEQAPELRADAWTLHRPEAPGWRDAWSNERSAEPRAATLVKQARLLKGEPIEVTLDAIERIELPYPQEQASRHQTWTAIRDREGRLMIPEHRYASVYIRGGLEKVPTTLVPQFIASHREGPKLEVQICRPGGLPIWANEFRVRCPDTTQSFAMTPLGDFGYAVRTQLADEDVLLLVAPAGSPHHAGSAQAFGQGSVAIEKIRLAKGHNGVVSRLSAFNFKWQQSALAAGPAAMVDVTWLSGADKPRILVASLSQQ